MIHLGSRDLGLKRKKQMPKILCAHSQGRKKIAALSRPPSRDIGWEVRLQGKCTFQPWQKMLHDLGSSPWDQQIISSQRFHF